MRSPISVILCLSAVIAPFFATGWTQSSQAEIIQLLAKRPKNATNTIKSTGVRGVCPVTGQQGVLTALIPATDPGVTTQSNPEFWFYLPFGRTTDIVAKDGRVYDVTTARFTLLDDQQQPVLSQPLILSLPAQAGIVSVKLPASEKPLEIGKDYQWFFSILCSDRNASTNPIVSGWVTRQAISPSLAQALKTPSPQSQVAAYKTNSIWYDYFSQLAKNRASLSTEWQQVLKQFDLSDRASSSVVQLQPASH